MAETDTAGVEDAPEEQTYAGTTEERLAEHPLLMTVGDCATSRVLVALLSHDPYPLTPASIAESAGVSRAAWYDVKDRLLEVGIVVERGERGNAPLYGLADDERTDALQKVRAISGAALRESRAA
jgi:hypothetical protein